MSNNTHELIRKYNLMIYIKIIPLKELISLDSFKHYKIINIFYSFNEDWAQSLFKERFALNNILLNLKFFNTKKNLSKLIKIK